MATRTQFLSEAESLEGGETMSKLIIVLAVLALAAGVATAKHEVYEPREIPEVDRVWGWFFFDDLEPPDPGWETNDLTATAVPHFHVDTYLAYGQITAVEEESWGAIKARFRGDQPRDRIEHSYWCGNFDYDADGGYGNSWDDRLNVPTTAFPAGAYEVITFYYRNDTEPAYDYSYVQAESAGAYVNLNRGFDGIHPWGFTGFFIGNKDNPAECRFRFVSDGAWSDEDGLYYSFGGAFHCDEITIFDYYTGNVHFYDDVETGGLCTPAVPAAAGSYWHTISNVCKAWSDPTVWVNTQPDTPGFVPPGVQDQLLSPTADISSAVTCTTWFIIQFFTPTVDNDYWTETVFVDGAGTQLHAWWGDQCDAGYTPCSHFLGGDDITSLLPGSAMYHQWVYYTTDNGAGPDICNNAGITIDDMGYYGTTGASRGTDWKRVKSMYR
jgi:hypothetical protein